MDTEQIFTKSFRFVYVLDRKGLYQLKKGNFSILPIPYKLKVIRPDNTGILLHQPQLKNDRYPFEIRLYKTDHLFWYYNNRVKVHPIPFQNWFFLLKMWDDCEAGFILYFFKNFTVNSTGIDEFINRFMEYSKRKEIAKIIH